MRYRNVQLVRLWMLDDNKIMEKFYYPSEREELWQYLSQASEQLEISIKRARMTRSLAQNRLLWAWMSEISKRFAEHYGEWHSKEVWYQYFTELFLNVDVIQIKGKIIKLKASTSDLEVKAFSEFLDQIEMYCASELNLQLIRTRDYREAHNG